MTDKKKGKKKRPYGAALALALVAVLAGCSMLQGLLPTSGPVQKYGRMVLDRHDAYVQADALLQSEVRDEFLAEAAEARKVLEPGQTIMAASLAGPLRPCMARHDAYVRADLGLSLADKELALAQTAMLRAALAASLGE